MLYDIPLNMYARELGIHLTGTITLDSRNEDYQQAYKFFREELQSIFYKKWCSTSEQRVDEDQLRDLLNKKLASELVWSNGISMGLDETIYNIDFQEYVRDHEVELADCMY